MRVEDGYVTRAEDLVLLPGAAEALARITAAGCRTVVVTNQRGLSRGLMSRSDLEAVHHRLAELVTAAGGRVDAIAVCPHAEGVCDCRKPRTGLFREALARAPWARSNRCLMIGDMPSDLEPAQLLGMWTRGVGAETRLESAVRDLFGASGTP